MKYIIKPSDIENINLGKIPNHSKELCQVLNEYTKYLLDVAMNYNESNECGLLLDIANIEQYRLFKGTETKVTLNFDFKILFNYESLESLSNRFVFIHNHPNNTSFSYQDIKSFIYNDFIYLAIVVQNNGVANVLMKLSNIFDDTKDFVNKYDGNIKDLISVLKLSNLVYYRRFTKNAKHTR